MSRQKKSALSERSIRFLQANVHIGVENEEASTLLGSATRQDQDAAQSERVALAYRRLANAMILSTLREISKTDGVDEIDEDGATCRTWADAPEIDGNLFIDEGFDTLSVGDIVKVTVDEAGEYDLWVKLT